MRLLAEKQRKYEDAVQTEFTLEDRLIGIAMGMRDEKRVKIEQEYKVSYSTLAPQLA